MPSIVPKYKSSHDHHWSALFGFDWMFETPSLLFSELDDSYLYKGINDEVELLRTEGKHIIIQSLVKKGDFYNYPYILDEWMLPIEFSNTEINPWVDHEVEESYVSAEVKGQQFTFYLSDYPEFPEHYQSCEQNKFMFGGLIHELVLADTPFTRANAFNDETTRLFENLEIVSFIEEQCFYHKGYFILLNSPDLGLIPAWLHAKNKNVDLQTGLKVDAFIWLQARGVKH